MENNSISQKAIKAEIRKRHKTTIKKNIPLLLKASFIGMIFGIIQYLINYFNLSFPREDENSLLFILIVFSFFAYIFFAGYAANRVLEESKEIGMAMLTDNKDKFLAYRDERLPFIIHLPIAITSFALVFSVLFFPYPEKMIGVVTVFFVVAIIMTIFFVTNEIDQYEHSTWLKEKTPPDWWEIDIEKHFKNKK